MYSPVQDSSPGYRTHDPKRLVLNLKTRANAKNVNPQKGRRFSCHCGCGEFPTGNGSRFLMGHDARLKSKLVRAALHGVEVRWLYDGHETGGLPAEEVAAAYGKSWTEAIDRAKLRRDGKERELLQRALQSPKLIKTGRLATGRVAVFYETTDPQVVAIETVTPVGKIYKTKVRRHQLEREEV